jgi:tetratricopeptide (TPR) repeat protein
MSEINLEERFPDLQPLRSAPSLMTINGIGLSMYGSRDYDEDTRTYVKTRCFCVVFVPLLAVDAYRVANAQKGWYFLGKVPLSQFAKVWNCLLPLVLLAGAGVGWWHHYSHSPEYSAGRQLAEAARLADAGQVGQAARVYRDVARGSTSQAAAAMERINNLTGEPAGQARPAEAAGVFQVAVELRQRYPAFGNLFPRGMELVNQHADADPAGALAVLEAVTPLAPDAKELTPKRQQLLEGAVAQEPENPEPAAKLALIFEARQDWDRCEALLTPHLHRLGTTEGARVLGQRFAHLGKFDQAHALLVPYTEGRLKQLHAAEQAFVKAVKEADKKIVESLNSKKAPGFSYDRYKAAGKVQQDTMVQEYIQLKLRDDPDVSAAREAMAREAEVVPVALDLGIVLLRRGQAQTDPEARRAELEKAEKTFLAVRGLAGQSDEYRLSLGQVYYWLGKHAEGRKLFDELLKAQKRNFETLLGVSRLLREVGAHSEARTLAEEAYQKEKDPTKKYQAAIQRALLLIDLDDRITWLRRANPGDLAVKASLSDALGEKALQEGKDAEAATHLREAIDLYARQAATATTLNNGALAHFSLYAVTGKRATLDKGVDMLDKAITLLPSDSILLHNAADSVLGVALRDIIGPAIDLKALKISGSQELLSYLYGDRPGRDELSQRVRQHAGIAKAIAYYERLLVLAPKNASAYFSLASLYRFTRNLEALRGLDKRLDGVELDLADSTRETLEYLRGKKDAQLQQEFKASIDRHEKQVAETRDMPNKATFAVAATHLVYNLTALDYLGQQVDPNRIVRLAEEAHTAAPSRATHGCLIGALLFRAHRALTEKVPTYAALAARTKRSVGTGYLVAVALSWEGPVQATAQSHPDVQRAVLLLKEAQAAFPDAPDPWTWAMIQSTYPDDAAVVRKALLEDELGRADRAIELRLAPVSGANVLQAYWAMQAAGEATKGRAILQAAADRGVPLPFDLK